MLHSAARMLTPLLRLLWPPSPEHRHPPCGCAVAVRDVPAPVRDVPALVLVRDVPEPDPVPLRAPDQYFRGEDTPLIRPYLLAHESRQAEARLRRSRPRALWITVHGVDIEPRLAHGREATG
ncbi:hypothetical protein ACFUGD_14755 [Streptomyces sp. NPDC057217]|uniref:hypothetical protein n=1 Tax=Streptomyces sp. NPDC057217 TaxID=3346054 RepID=UPI0036413B9A